VIGETPEWNPGAVGRAFDIRDIARAAQTVRQVSGVQRSGAPFLNFVERVIAVVERRNERSARVGSLAKGQDDGRRGTQTNDGMGRERHADTAPVQAKDPKRAENEGDSEQCHS
jgi:hypothetical protein